MRARNNSLLPKFVTHKHSSTRLTHPRTPPCLKRLWLLGSYFSLGRVEGCVCFIVCVVRMWLAPLNSHDLLTIPMVV